MSEKTIAVELTESEIGYLSGKKMPCDGIHCQYLQKSIVSKTSDAYDQVNAPKIGDRCAFWDDEKDIYTIGYYGGKRDNLFICNNEKYNEIFGFEHCAPIKQEAVF